MNKSENPVRVLIADSQFLITESLKFLLHDEGLFFVINVVSEKTEILKELTEETVSLMIIDPSLIDLSSISELKEIKRSFPDLKFLVITNSLIKSELHELNNLGMTNIILKTAGKEEILKAINATLKGKKYYSNELLEIMFEATERETPVEETVQLTKSEVEIVRLVAEGLTTKEIAAQKFISFHTVISHRKNIFRKLGVKSISELIMYAIKAGLINSIEYYI
jgi:DNA-binding NarL/FixJ family response regulator